MRLTSVELCAGAGGQAVGLEKAGFDHLACVEYDKHACTTLRTNRPKWNTVETDLLEWSGAPYRGRTDLVAGGVPCPPFSKAGRQLGADDERNLFPRALDLIEEIDPRAVMIENVRGLMDPVFEDFRQEVLDRLESLGYKSAWNLLKASDFGVSQLRPRTILVGIKDPWAEHFVWPTPHKKAAPSVGALLRDHMAANGWEGADAWAEKADTIAPTLVGGSLKHGGPDLGPTRARAAWAELGVEGRTIGNEPPGPGHVGMPRITVQMGALIQGFPEEWIFPGTKTASWRQVGNAFPPPVAEAVGKQIRKALNAVTVEPEEAVESPAEPAVVLPQETREPVSV